MPVRSGLAVAWSGASGYNFRSGEEERVRVVRVPPDVSDDTAGLNMDQPSGAERSRAFEASAVGTVKKPGKARPPVAVWLCL
jgi:hypothetical protein